MNGKWFRLFLAGLMVMTLVLAGCEGDDGDDGGNVSSGRQEREEVWGNQKQDGKRE